jgi:hypothetical protein
MALLVDALWAMASRPIAVAAACGGTSVTHSPSVPYADFEEFPQRVPPSVGLLVEASGSADVLPRLMADIFACWTTIVHGLQPVASNSSTNMHMPHGGHWELAVQRNPSSDVEIGDASVSRDSHDAAYVELGNGQQAPNSAPNQQLLQQDATTEHCTTKEGSSCNGHQPRGARAGRAEQKEMDSHCTWRGTTHGMPPGKGQGLLEAAAANCSFQADDVRSS